jgi:AP-3 complex subunit beta
LIAVAKPLIRLLYETSAVAEAALLTVLSVSLNYQYIFVPHLNHFFVRKSESTRVKKLKIRILSLLANEGNANAILNELSFYAGSTDREFAAAAVKTIGQTALQNESIIPETLISLLRLMGRAEGSLLAEVVMVLATLLRKRRGTDDEAHALRHLCRKFVVLTNGEARAAVLSIVGDMHETHPEFAPQLLRYIAQTFDEASGEVRLQALTLGAKLMALGADPGIPLFLLKKCERDTEFDVRDRARLLLALVESTTETRKARLKGLLFPPRKEPDWGAAEKAALAFQIGTFSQLFGRTIGGYEALPDWAEEAELPADSVRNSARTMPGTGQKTVDFAEDAGEDDGGGVLGIDDFFGRESVEEEDANQYYSDEETGQGQEGEGQIEQLPAKEDEPAEDLDDFFD